MDQDQWKRINSIFHDALDLAPSERLGFVAVAAHGDEYVQAEVKALLRADENAGSYLESPFVGQRSLADDVAILAPDTLLCSRFRVIGKIAEGGMGQVYEAFDTELGSPVALKVIRPEIASDPAVLARFRQEVKLARRITHPNVCRTFDFEHDVVTDEIPSGAQRDIYFLTMEFLPGETLGSRIRRTGALSTDEALEIARQIADAVDSAHALGIIHRDLKPGNLMIAPKSSGDSSREIRAVITDFGLARITPLSSDDDVPSISNFQGWPIGTIAYMSPEQLEGSRVSTASDIYSFGLILFEMIAGKRPFPSASFLEGITQRLAGIAPKELSNLPEPWRGAINWCLRTKPVDRPISAAQVISAIEGRCTAPAIAKKWPLWKGIGKYSWATFSSALVIMTTWYLLKPQSPPHVVSYRRLTYDGRTKKLGGTDGSQLYFTFDYASLGKLPVEGGKATPIPISIQGNGYRILDVSRDGSQLLVGVAKDKDSSGYPFRSLCVASTQGRTRRCFAEGIWASFSPDGNSIVYLNLEHELRVLRMNERIDRKIVTLGPTAFDVHWSPDGKTIRFANAGSIWNMRPDGTGLHRLIPETYGSNELGKWSVDGSIYAFLHTEPFANQIWALDERQRLGRSPAVPIRLTNGPISWDIPTPSPDGKHIYAIGEIIRGELVQVDSHANQLVPFLGGMSAISIAFSRDGKSIAYVSFPEGSLWKANRDGSNPVQLTKSPTMFVWNPRWSPDGKRIVFTDMPGPNKWVSYVISAEGGLPQRLLPGDKDDERDPNWAPDGKSVVLDGGQNADDPKASYLRILDIDSRTVKMLPDSQGLSSPRWSSDGRYIAALSQEKPALRVYDWKTRRWTGISVGGNIVYLTFSSDNRYLYYEQRPGNDGVYRIQIPNGSPELVFSFGGWQLIGMSNYAQAMSLDPTDTPLLLQNVGSCDIYDLKLGR